MSIIDEFFSTGLDYYNIIKYLNLSYKYLSIKNTNDCFTIIPIICMIFKKTSGVVNISGLQVIEQIVEYDKDNLIYEVHWDNNYGSNERIHKCIRTTISKILDGLNKNDINDIKILVGLIFYKTTNSHFLKNHKDYSEIPNAGIGYLDLTGNITFEKNDNYTLLCDFNKQNMKKLIEFLTIKI